MLNQRCQPYANDQFVPADTHPTAYDWQNHITNVSEPDAPSLVYYSKLIYGDASDSLHFLPPQDTILVSRFKVFFYCHVNIDPTVGADSIIMGPNGLFDLKPITILNTSAWYTHELTGLNIDLEDFLNTFWDLSVSFESDANVLLKGCYAEIDYNTGTPPIENNAPLPHKPNRMSGYNYFVQKYIQQKNQLLPPYKLPDGTLFP
jgi:hypothetical protein